MKNICIWSSPRNISTALMYSFSQRSDIRVVDEPFYGHYLKTYAGLDHPGQDEIIEQMDTSLPSLINALLTSEKKVIFNKMMTKHIQGMDWGFLGQVNNALLIRNPRAIIHSYSKVIPEINIDDIGIHLQRKIYDHLLALDLDVPIIDTSDVLKNPKKILTKFCERLGLQWSENMLQWERGPIPEDGIWAKYWYGSIHQSTGFKPNEEREFQLSPELEKLAEDCQPFYDYLYKNAIK